MDVGKYHMNRKRDFLRWMTYLCVYKHGMILPCDQSPLWHSMQLVFKKIFLFHYIVLEAASSLITVLEKYMLSCYIVIKKAIL